MAVQRDLAPAAPRVVTKYVQPSGELPTVGGRRVEVLWQDSSGDGHRYWTAETVDVKVDEHGETMHYTFGPPLRTQRFSLCPHS